MYTSVLVPLDRSPVAELALPFAVAIAQRAQAALELVEVHRSYVFDNPHAANAWALKLDLGEEAEIVKQEQGYLAETAKRVTTGSPLSATTTVLSGTVAGPWFIADRIMEEAHLKRADLIVMATRVRGLVSRLGLGSVADDLVRRAHIPVLLVWASHEDPPSGPEPVLDNFLIPLDGSVLSEQILVPALELARLMNARCTLLRVVAPKSGVQAEEKQAEQYLERVAATPRQQGLQVQAQVVMAKHPAEAILNAAQTQKSNLIALATHGYGGFKRLVLGSVADKIIRHAPLPVLVHCPALKR
jgi:nucleotide-binding universal stress UspA family protein